MPTTDLLTPDWLLEFEIEGKRTTTTVHDVADLLPSDQMPKGAKFKVGGTPTAGSYVYVVQLGANRTITQVYPSPRTAAKAALGVPQRLPTVGWFLAPITGAVRVVEAPRPIGAAEWVELLHGRDPPVRGTSPTNSGPVAPKKPQKPKDTKVAGAPAKKSAGDTRRSPADRKAAARKKTKPPTAPSARPRPSARPSSSRKPKKGGR